MGCCIPAEYPCRVRHVTWLPARLMAQLFTFDRTFPGGGIVFWLCESVLQPRAGPEGGIYIYMTRRWETIGTRDTTAALSVLLLVKAEL